MEVTRFPADMDKDTFLTSFSVQMLDCIKAGMGSSYEQEFTPEGDESWFHYLRKNLDDGVNYILLSSDGRFRGYAVWKQHGDSIHIYDLIIRPEYQMDIITLRKLLVLLAEDISGLDASKLWAYTNYRNMRMNSILTRHGFTETERKRNGTVYTADLRNFINKFSKER